MNFASCFLSFSYRSFLLNWPWPWKLNRYECANIFYHPIYFYFTILTANYPSLCLSQPVEIENIFFLLSKNHFMEFSYATAIILNSTNHKITIALAIRHYNLNKEKSNWVCNVRSKITKRKKKLIEIFYFLLVLFSKGLDFRHCNFDWIFITKLFAISTYFLLMIVERKWFPDSNVFPTFFEVENS